MTVGGTYSFIVLGDAPPSEAAPTVVDPSPDLNFNLSSVRPGVPGIVDAGGTFARHRDWTQNFGHPDYSFSAVRWTVPWLRHDANYGFFEPASADIYRIHRKGSAGADAQTLVFTCSPNTAPVPAGESVVVWDSTAEDAVTLTTTHDLSGYALPTRSKLTVSASTPSAMLDAAGRRLIEVNTGAALPAIDFSPSWYAGQYVQKSTMQLRHWAFYKNSATKALRNPLANYAKITREALSGGGHVVIGGTQFATTTNDWSKEYLAFGASLTEELFRLECEGLANMFGNTDPRKLAVQLEHSPIHTWETVGIIPGHRYLLSEVFYPIAREAWGQERTLMLRSPGGTAGLLDDFDLPCPKGHNTHLVAHCVPGEVSGPMGLVDFTTIEQTDWLAGEIADKINELGYRGGGITSLGITPPVAMQPKAERLGRMLTSVSNKQLYAFYYANLGSNPDTTFDVADIYSIGGTRIEALHPPMREYARRAGLMME